MFTKEQRETRPKQWTKLNNGLLSKKEERSLYIDEIDMFLTVLRKQKQTYESKQMYYKLIDDLRYKIDEINLIL